MRAVLYIRVSTRRQEYGIEAQREACERFALGAGLEIVHEEIDHKSGDIQLSNRAGLLNSINALSDCDAQVLLVYRRGRLSRGDVFAMAVIEHQVERAGARVMAAEGAANGETSEALLFRRVLDAVSEYELALIRARTKAAVDVKKKRGECVGNIPYGYRRNGKLLVTDDDEQQTIEVMAAMRATGEAYRRIGPAMHKQGIANRKGKPFTAAQIHKLLKREASNE